MTVKGGDEIQPGRRGSERSHPDRAGDFNFRAHQGRDVNPEVEHIQNTTSQLQ